MGNAIVRGCDIEIVCDGYKGLGQWQHLSVEKAVKFRLVVCLEVLRLAVCLDVLWLAVCLEVLWLAVCLEVL